jgi:hypothetical protein
MEEHQFEVIGGKVKIEDYGGRTGFVRAKELDKKKDEFNKLGLDWLYDLYWVNEFWQSCKECEYWDKSFRVTVTDLINAMKGICRKFYNDSCYWWRKIIIMVNEFIDHWKKHKVNSVIWKGWNQMLFALRNETVVPMWRA